MWGYLLCIILGLTAAAAVIFWERQKEQRMWDSLEKRIEDARNGKFEILSIDETNKSSLENALNRLLEDSYLAEENVKVQKDRIQTLISDISHQTVIPISNILLYSQLLEEQLLETEYSDQISSIREQTEKLEFLIHSLVKISRMENGIITTTPAMENVTDMLGEVTSQARQKARQKNITLDLKEPKEEISAYFDLRWTVEAIYNIVDNAIKYTDCGGEVKIMVYPYTIFIRIDIIDNGVGMTEEELPKIFGRFYRCERTNKETGVGLGLYLARDIINSEGGYIKTATALSEGTTFSVYLLRTK